MRYTKRSNRFGVVLPPDSDPRWIITPYVMTQDFAMSAMPMGTVLHPSGRAYMNDYNLWSQINAEREANFAVQREVRRLQEIENERIRKEQEKARIAEEKRIKKEREAIQKQIDRVKRDYQREIRAVTRPVDAQYNSQLANLEKQLKNTTQMPR